MKRRILRRRGMVICAFCGDDTDEPYMDYYCSRECRDKDVPFVDEE